MLIKKYSQTLFLACLLSNLLACQQNTATTISLSAQTLISELSSQDQVYHAAYNSASTAAFMVKITAIKPSLHRSFTTLNSSSGTAAKDMVDVQALRVFLCNSSTLPSGLITPFNGQVFTITAPSSSQTIVFDNVPANNYFVCAAAFSNTGTFDIGTNLTDKSTSTVNYAEGQVFCSTTGGETGNPGRVTVDSAYQVSDTTTLNVPLQLQSIVGATIDSSITVIDGT